jgi:hypothetical protein
MSVNGRARSPRGRAGSPEREDLRVIFALSLFLGGVHLLERVESAVSAGVDADRRDRGAD